MTAPRVSIDIGDGWEELSGVTRIAIDEQHQPIGWPVFDEEELLRTLFTEQLRRAQELHRALAILAPHLARCPLYRGA